MALKVDDRRIRKFLRDTKGALGERNVKAIAGRAGTNLVKAHLRARDVSHPNKLGGRRTHFYAAAARATNYRPVSGGVLISINHIGIAQRYFGGEIRPVNAKRLAVPARAEAHGKSPADFTDLEIAVFGETVALVQREQTLLRSTPKGLRPGPERGGGVFFWLVESVHQDPDEDVLPKQADLENAVRREVLAYVDSVKARGKAAR